MNLLLLGAPMRVSPLLVLLASCNWQVGLTPPGSTTDPVGSTGSTTDCAWRVIGPAGGELTHAGVAVTFPVGALATATEVTLCSAAAPAGLVPASEVVELTPADLVLAVPATVTVPHTGAPGDGTALWANGADGIATRQLRAVDAAQTFTGPLYRAGIVLAAPDLRALEPYAPLAARADLLFVIDNSCSMADQQATVAAAVPALLAELDASGLDWHIAVTTTDMDGNYDGAQGTFARVHRVEWVETVTPDREALVEELLTRGVHGSGAERGLGASYAAIELLEHTTNAGFQRDDAQLAVVVVSDEPDLTPDSAITDAEYELWFEARKASPAMTFFHAFAPIWSNYVDMAQAVGGLVYDIDELDDPVEWADYMARVAIDAFYVDEMPLAGAPVDGLVEVWVLPADGGEPHPIDPASFVFDAEGNSLQVLGLADGDEAVVLYLPI